jgi:hypothetical protein
MELDKILAKVKKDFAPRKKVDFEEFALHFELEPLTSFEDAKILTALKDFEPTQYIAALKRHTLACSVKKINDIDLSGEDVQYEDEKGEKKMKSKYLYMVDFMGKCPSLLIDGLFDAFTAMNAEAEELVKKGIKFERIILTEDVPEEKPKKFRPVNDEIPVEQMSDVERLERKVEKEIADADSRLAEAEVAKE